MVSFCFFILRSIFLAIKQSKFLLKSQFVHRRIAFVVAHPDDEVMFFGNAINSLKSSNECFVLCLSTGNANGLGSIREKELLTSLSILGIASTNVKIVDDIALQDGMHQSWDEEIAANYVSEFVLAHNVEVILTFDDCGVSGHINHVAVSKAVAHFVATQQYNVVAFGLESLSLFRKYIGPFDICLSYLLSKTKTTVSFMGLASLPEFHVFSICRNWLTLWHAMQAHQSQFVWYRRLFIVFSSYSYINHFRPLLYRDSSAKRDRVTCLLTPWKIFTVVLLFVPFVASSAEPAFSCTYPVPNRVFNVLITGGAGYIGSHMALRLLQGTSENIKVFLLLPLILIFVLNSFVLQWSTIYPGVVRFL
jgi:N-acetylglucosaminylphosphatidylinositol deacetylase